MFWLRDPILQSQNWGTHPLINRYGSIQPHWLFYHRRSVFEFRLDRGTVSHRFLPLCFDGYFNRCLFSRGTCWIRWSSRTWSTCKCWQRKLVPSLTLRSGTYFRAGIHLVIIRWSTWLKIHLFHHFWCLYQRIKCRHKRCNPSGCRWYCLEFRE